MPLPNAFSMGSLAFQTGAGRALSGLVIAYRQPILT
jgi:hypothetical protein